MPGRTALAPQSRARPRMSRDGRRGGRSLAQESGRSRAATAGTPGPEVRQSSGRRFPARILVARGSIDRPDSSTVTAKRLEWISTRPPPDPHVLEAAAERGHLELRRTRPKLPVHRQDPKGLRGSERRHVELQRALVEGRHPPARRRLDAGEARVAEGSESPLGSLVGASATRRRELLRPMSRLPEAAAERGRCPSRRSAPPGQPTAGTRRRRRRRLLGGPEERGRDPIDGLRRKRRLRQRGQLGRDRPQRLDLGGAGGAALEVRPHPRRRPSDAARVSSLPAGHPRPVPSNRTRPVMAIPLLS